VAAGTGQGEDAAMSVPAVEAVAFDVNETLFSLDRLRPPFTDAGLDAQAVPVWFAGLLRDGFALTPLGGYRPFAEVAAETLRGLDKRAAAAPVRSPQPVDRCGAPLETRPRSLPARRHRTRRQPTVAGLGRRPPLGLRRRHPSCPIRRAGRVRGGLFAGFGAALVMPGDLRPGRLPQRGSRRRCAR